MLTTTASNTTPTALQLGFAVPWRVPRQATWSGTPFSLLHALQQRTDCSVRDVDVALKAPHSFIHKMRHARLHRRKVVSSYMFTPSYLQHTERTLHTALRTLEQQTRLNAVLQIGDLGRVEDVPYFVYQDLTVQQYIRYIRETGKPVPGFEQFSLDDFQRRDQWQRRFYERCAACFTMSAWAAQSLVQDYGFAAERVHVVQAGCNVQLQNVQLQSAPNGYANRFDNRLDSRLDSRTTNNSTAKTVLFVGRDFFRKGGAVVVEAVRRLHEQAAFPVRLLVAGPKVYPLGAVPEFVTFLGDVAWQDLQPVFAGADVFCMPSYWEGFGIVFAEALSAGVPCIGRNTCAMPELLDDGVTGYLLQNDDPDELAELLSKALDNAVMKTHVQSRIPTLRQHYSWERVAADMVRVMRQHT